MDQACFTHTGFSSANPERVIELVWRQQGPDHWTAVLTDYLTRRRLQATSTPELAIAINQLIHGRSDCPDPDEDRPVDR